jgi:hypothetical protein
MSQNERLRALLAEARIWVAPGSDARARIDAALAEPGDVHPSNLTDVVTLLENDRDEARAEIEHWKGAAKEHAENHAAAVEAFHDATRLRSEIQQARIAAEIERDEARAEVERLKEALEDAAGDMHQRIRAGYDKTIADCWRAKVAEVEKQRDALRVQNEHMSRAIDDAIKIQKKAVADAYKRGAEAMCEAAVQYIKHASHEDGVGMGSLRMESGIRSLPIPEDK